MKLILVRHAQSEANIGRILHIHPGAPLSDEGRRQAIALGKRLKDENITIILSSDSPRAVDTCQAIAAYHPAVPWVTDARLREQDVGVFTGKAATELEDAIVNSGKNGFEYLPLEGEDGKQVATRVRAVISELIEKYHGKIVVIVTHSLTLSHVLYDALHLTKHRETAPKNASITILEVAEDGSMRAVIDNDTEHLSKTL